MATTQHLTSTRVYYVELCVNDTCDRYTSAELKNNLDNFLSTIEGIRNNFANPSYFITNFNTIKDVFQTNIDLFRKICKLIYKMITTANNQITNDKRFSIRFIANNGESIGTNSLKQIDNIDILDLDIHRVYKFKAVAEHSGNPGLVFNSADAEIEIDSKRLFSLIGILVNPGVNIFTSLYYSDIRFVFKLFNVLKIAFGHSKTDAIGQKITTIELSALNNKTLDRSIPDVGPSIKETISKSNIDQLDQLDQFGGSINTKSKKKGSKRGSKKTSKRGSKKTSKRGSKKGLKKTGSKRGSKKGSKRNSKK